MRERGKRNQTTVREGSMDERMVELEDGEKGGLQNPNSPAVSARPPYLFEPWRSMPSAWQAWREKGFDSGSAVPTSWRVGTPCLRPPTINDQPPTYLAS